MPPRPKLGLGGMVCVEMLIVRLAHADSDSAVS